MKTKWILVADALFIGVTGALQMVQELRGHFLQQGWYAGQFAHSPYTIGFFEAHGLATLFAVSFVFNLNGNRRFWHAMALTVHLLLGGANLMFWQSFVAFDFVTQGIVVTTLHGFFILANLYALRKEFVS